MKQGSTMIAFSYLVEKIDFVIPWPQISVYKLYAQVARLTTLCIEYSMKIPTIWYIATLVPLGVQRILFLPGSSKGLLNFLKHCPGYFFCFVRSSWILFLLTSLSWIFFFKKSSSPPHKNQMVAP